MQLHKKLTQLFCRLTEIYIHLKDVLKNVSESPVDTTFYTEGITKDMNVSEKKYFYLGII